MEKYVCTSVCVAGKKRVWKKKCARAVCAVCIAEEKKCTPREYFAIGKNMGALVLQKTV